MKQEAEEGVSGLKFQTENVPHAPQMAEVEAAHPNEMPGGHEGAGVAADLESRRSELTQHRIGIS